MPSFIKDLSLRRKSKSSFKVAEVEIASSENTSLSNEGGHDKPLSQRNKSSSTLSSFFDKASPPLNSASTSHLPSTSPSEAGHYGPTPPPVPGNRPRLASAQAKRYSLVGSAMLDEGRQTSTTSPLAPRVLSVSDGSWVHQKVLLISGQCADPQVPIDGTICVYHHQDNFPMQQWPVNDSHFKALVHLQPGPNRLRLDFTSPRLHSPGGTSVHTSWISINYLPFTSTPPVQLCIIVGSDSPGTYDATPERIAKEGNDLAVATRKFKMAAYLWQAFTAEQMSRNNLGRRCYRYEEEWQQGTLSLKDFEAGQMRNEAKIHVVRLDKTVAEIRDADVAQQNPNAQRSGELFGWASDAVRKYFNPAPGQTQYVSCLYLDAHWDKEANLLRGHAALGGGDDTIKLAIFGSHCLQSYPAHLEEVVPSFNDCTRTDTNYVVNDCGEAGSSWEAANIGIGASLHETGHLLGCPHQESGVMLRDYVTLHRTFLTRESFSTRTKQPGQKLIRPEDECGWHRLDVLRFRYHPCFGIPNDVLPRQAGTIQVWGVDNASVLITTTSGIAWIELFPEGDGECHHWIEYSNHASPVPDTPRQIELTERDLKQHLPDHKRGKKLRIVVFSCSGENHEVADINALMVKNVQTKLPDGRPAFKSSMLGHSARQGVPHEVILSTAWKQKEPLLSVRIYHGMALDGMEFFYEGGKSHLFGKRGGKEGGDEFAIDFRKGETILGFYVRAGAWIDGVQILTSTGRRSELYGNNGGSGHTLIPPRGYSIAGVYGTCGDFVDGFGLVITR